MSDFTSGVTYDGWRTLRRQAAICAEKGAGLGLNFLGLIIIIALNGYNGYFSRYFN